MYEAKTAPAIKATLGESGEDDIRKHVYMFTPQTALGIHDAYAKNLLNDAQLINGFGPNQMGTFAPGRRTKYETQVVEASNTTRLSYRRVKIADMIRGHTIRANYLISKYWDGDIVEQVVGVDGALYWVKAGMDQMRNIQDALVTNVNVDSLAPVSRERRKMEATNLLSLLTNVQQAGINTLPLVKQLLSTYEWLDVRQILPQMAGEYEIQAWQALQQKKLNQGTAGPEAAQNLQGVQALAGRLPTEAQGGQNAAEGYAGPNYNLDTGEG